MLRPPAVRRGKGQFWTPAGIVDPMISWALEANPTRVVDPGCGSGRFSTAVIRRDPTIEIVALDRDPLATLLTRAALAVLGAKDARVICDDYLQAELPRHHGKTAWVGNPPYVRHHRLTPETKTWASQAARETGFQISGLAGLHALFFVATVVHAKRGDIGSFVTSAEWLDVGYGSIVRNLFTNGMGGRALDLVDPAAVTFYDAMTTTLVSSFEIGRQIGDIAIKLVRVPAQLARLETGRRVSVSAMAAQKRWSPMFKAAPPVAPTSVLSDVARVHRGFATGANRFFLMTRREAEERGLTGWTQAAVTLPPKFFIAGELSEMNLHSGSCWTCPQTWTAGRILQSIGTFEKVKQRAWTSATSPRTATLGGVWVWEGRPPSWQRTWLVRPLDSL